MPFFFTAITVLLNIISAGGFSYETNPNSGMPPNVLIPPGGTWKSFTVNYDDKTLNVSKDKNGNIISFPYYYNNSFIQIDAEYGGSGINLIKSRKSGEEDDETAFEIEFLKNEIARVNYGGTYFFVSFNRDGPEIIETWFNTEGLALAVNVITFSRENGSVWTNISVRSDEKNTQIIREYDDAGRIIRYKSDEDEWIIYRGAKGESYSETGGASYEFQFDERDLPVRCKIISPEAGAAESYLEYKWTLNNSQNTSECTAVTFEERFGVLVATEERIYKRSVVY